MRYATIKKNDTINVESGISVSLFVQGCPHHCCGCWNPETWDFNGGQQIEYTQLKKDIFSAIEANGINRNFSVLGGEPLCLENRHWVSRLIHEVKKRYPKIKILLWTGYTIEELQKQSISDIDLTMLLLSIDILIDGEYDQSKRDITLPLRGSANQRILHRGIDF